MTVPSQENGPVDNGNPDPNQNPGHPAWQEILDVLPSDLHGLVTPKLKQWDEGVTARLNEIKEQYKPYEPYEPIVKNNIDPRYLEQAVLAAQELQQDPEAFVQRAIEHFKLDKFRQQEVEPNMYDNDDDNNYDIENDPRYKALAEKQREIEEYIQAQREAQEEAQASSQVRGYLEQLHEQHGDFNDLYVTALMAQGIDGEVAVQQFRDTVNQAAQALTGNQQQVPAPPVVMGAGGTTGSGTPESPVNFGTMKRGEINDLVTQMLEKSQQQT